MNKRFLVFIFLMFVAMIFSKPLFAHGGHPHATSLKGHMAYHFEMARQAKEKNSKKSAEAGKEANIPGSFTSSAY